jgi:hypothetical protein
MPHIHYTSTVEFLRRESIPTALRSPFHPCPPRRLLLLVSWSAAKVGWSHLWPTGVVALARRQTLLGA